MKQSIAEICRFTVSTPPCRHFVEGERVLHAGHVIFCGKEAEDKRSLKDKTHEIREEINKRPRCSKRCSLE